MSVNMHPLFPYRDIECFIGCKDWDIYLKNLEFVVLYFDDESLNYTTIKEWPFGRFICFYIQWKYTWNILLNSHNEPNKESMDEKLKHALSCAHIPGASMSDFFEISPEQIRCSDAAPKYHITIWRLIDYGVYFCEIAERAKQENTEVQNNNIFMTLILVFVLQSNSLLHLAAGIFSTNTVLDAFQHLSDMWYGYRNTFADGFAKLKASYEDKKQVSKEQLWTLISCFAPAQANANDNAQAAPPP